MKLAGMMNCKTIVKNTRFKNKIFTVKRQTFLVHLCQNSFSEENGILLKSVFLYFSVIQSVNCWNTVLNRWQDVFLHYGTLSTREDY